MDECNECVVNGDKCCAECTEYDKCKDTVDFVNPPDEYPDCWKCAGKKNGKCTW